jgi:hypothetical protein
VYAHSIHDAEVAVDTNIPLGLLLYFAFSKSTFPNDLAVQHESRPKGGNLHAKVGENSNSAIFLNLA